MIELLHSIGNSISTLQKPEKVFLENTNLLYALSEEQPSIGSVRETFFVNQLSVQHTVHHSPKTDFIIDNKYSFEIGGKNKDQQQIVNLKDAWVVKDNMEFPVAKSIPLWLFGWLY